jgi:sporulation protein YlmC with PRC-barrel domain
MTSDKIWLRSDLLGTQVITRDTGKRLGVVSQLWVDVDRREVVALGLRENLLSGVLGNMPQFMSLSSIRQIGDVALVEDDLVIEDINVDGYSTLINSEVITETGELLGKVRGFRFNVEDGTVHSLIIASLGLPLIPDQVISTYELPIEEIVSSGPDRLIVFEGAEERVIKLTVGLLERIGIGGAPWERDEEEDYILPTAPAENQLGTGIRIPTAQQPLRTPQPVVEEAWDEDDWAQQPAPKQLRQQRQPEPYYYDDAEDDNWSEASDRDRYADNYNDEEDFEDAWADEPYKPQKLNLPEKTKAPEYEEEGY